MKMLTILLLLLSLYTKAEAKPVLVQRQAMQQMAVCQQQGYSHSFLLSQAALLFPADTSDSRVDTTCSNGNSAFLPVKESSNVDQKSNTHLLYQSNGAYSINRLWQLYLSHNFW